MNLGKANTPSKHTDSTEKNSAETTKPLPNWILFAGIFTIFSLIFIYYRRYPSISVANFPRDANYEISGFPSALDYFNTLADSLDSKILEISLVADGAIKDELISKTKIIAQDLLGHKPYLQALVGRISVEKSEFRMIPESAEACLAKVDHSLASFQSLLDKIGKTTIQLK